MATAERISPAEWDIHKGTISTVYVTDNKTLDEVIQHMRDTYGFYATKAQYVRKLKQWCLEKNSTKAKWEFAASQVRKRRLEGKETEISISGRPVSAKKLRREMRRYVGPDSSSEIVSNDSHGVIVRTPPAEMAVSIQYTQIPWFQFQDLLDSSSLWMGTAAIDDFRFPTSPHNLPTRSGIYMSVSYPSGSTGLPSTPLHEGWNIPTGFTSEGLLEPTTSGMLHMGEESQLLPSVQPRALSTLEEASREARELLGGCLNASIDPDSPEYVSKISSCLEDIAIERCNGDLVRHIETLSSGTSARDTTLQLLRFAVYLTSNNFLSGQKVDTLLRWIIRSGGFSSVVRLLDTGAPSVEIFAVNLLVSAARLGELGVARTLIAKGISLDSVVGAGGGEKVTALQEAVRRRNTVLVRLLLDAGANPNSHDKCSGAGRTALLDAITGRSGGLEIAEMLIGRGADVNVQVKCWAGSTVLKAAVYDDDIDTVRMLLRAGADTNDFNGETALQIAAWRDDVEMVEAVLDTGADVNCPAGKAYKYDCEKAAQRRNYDFFETSLQRAVSSDNTEVVQVLLGEGADANGFPAADYLQWLGPVGEGDCGYVSDSDSEGDDLTDLHTPLQKAVCQSNFVLVRLLLSEGADVDAVGGSGTALQIAAAMPEGYRLVQLLLRKGADVNSPARVPWSSTALQAATGSRNKEMVKLLLDEGAYINAPPSRHGGRTALQKAAESGNLGMVKLLVGAGADVNADAAPEKGRTCLQAAVWGGDARLLNYLLQLGANVNGPASAQGGRTALQAAVERKKSDLVELFLEAGADVRAPPSLRGGLQPLSAALENESYEIAQLLLNKGADPNEDYATSSPLGVAAANGAAEMVRCLILAGADVNKKPVCGETALGNAALNGHGDIVGILIDAGAAIDCPNGTVALENAVKGNFVDIAKVLLAKGVSPNKPRAERGRGSSALQLAVERWAINDDMIRLLLNHGADVGADGGCCLQIAARKGSRHAVEILVAAGADVNSPVGADGTTALQGAILSRNTSIVYILLDAGADINAPPSPSWGTTALQAAVDIGDKNMVRLLLSRGANVDGPPSRSHGATALQKAAIGGRLAIALMLLQAGAEVNGAAAVKGGRTALEAAAEHGRLDIAVLLLENDDNTDAEAAKIRYRRAAKLASDNGHLVLAGMLQKWKGPGAEAAASMCNVAGFSPVGIF